MNVPKRNSIYKGNGRAKNLESTVIADEIYPMMFAGTTFTHSSGFRESALWASRAMTGAWLMAAAGQATVVKLQTNREFQCLDVAQDCFRLLHVEDALLPEFAESVGFYRFADILLLNKKV